MHIIRLDVDTESTDVAPASSPVLFRADREGRRLAYMQRPGGRGTPAQYFLHDFDTGTSTQLSDAPDAIDITPVEPRCVDALGGTPLISGDGARVVVLTPSTLGLQAQPWVAGACNVLEYDVALARWRHVATLPADMDRISQPVLDDAGTLLSFIASRPLPDGGSRTTPYLLSLADDALVPLPAALYDEPGYDSVVTRDGSALIVSSRGDLDPQGGNADRNMELFRLALDTMTFEQVTFTTGGIGRFPNGCQSLTPSRSDDGSVLVFETMIYSIPPCQLDGPTIDERTGMVLKRVRTVPRRPDNGAPTLAWRGATEVAVGEELVLALAGSDPDGDPLTFYANPVPAAISLPAGSTFTQDGPQDATLRWRPEAAQRGTHHLRLAVFDEGGDVATADVSLTVCAARYDGACRARTVAALFGSPAGACGDVNADGAVTAADLVAVSAHAEACMPDQPW